MDDSYDAPPFAALRAFEAFGRTGGTRRAARALNISHAVVSRHLRALEDFVGTALIDRESSVRTMTPDGAEYHRRISAALQEISLATQVVQRRNRPLLLVWCSPGLAYHWLAPKLPAFNSVHPEIELELRPIDYRPNFATNEADADIRYLRFSGGDILPPATRQLELMRPEVFPVANPQHAASIEGRLRTPADLLEMRLLHEENDQEWRAWLTAQGISVDAAVLPGPRLWHAHVMLESARAGEGIALTNAFLAGSYLESGELVPLRTTHRPLVPTALGAYAFTARTDRWHERGLAHMRTWLAQLGSGSAHLARTAVSRT